MAESGSVYNGVTVLLKSRVFVGRALNPLTTRRDRAGCI
jgi:hypothetical protein